MATYSKGDEKTVTAFCARHLRILIAAAAAVVAIAAQPASAAAADSQEFGVSSFTTSVLDTAGNDFTQAGGHAVSANADIHFNIRADNPAAPFGDVKSIRSDLPAGFVGNPQVIAGRCDLWRLQLRTCPSNSIVGAVVVSNGTIVGGQSVSPLWAMVPEKGYPAEFGFAVTGSPPYTLYPSLRSDGDYGLTLDAPSIGSGDFLKSSSVTLCGFGTNIIDLGSQNWNFVGCKAPTDPGASTVPLLTNPVDCSAGPPQTTITVNSWQEPGVFKSYSAFAATPPNLPSPVTGCDQLNTIWTSSQEPSLRVEPETTHADTPTGVDVALHVPQDGLGEAGGLATPALDNTTVTLPAGVSLTPGAADGLAACTEAQIGILSKSPIRFDKEAPACPDASKVGSFEVSTPLLENDLRGSVYIAAQKANPFGSDFAIYLAIDDAQTGIVFKLAGKVSPDPVTGQLSAAFAESPQLPFEDLKLHFFGGSRAALVTPSTCGEFTTSTKLTPWSAVDPANPTAAETATPTTAFKIDSGPGGSACVATSQGRRFAPGFVAGTEAPTAGAASPFMLKLSRADGEQELSSLDATMPLGFSAALKGVGQCSEAEIEAARHQVSGRAEQSHPSCPASSQVGVLTTGAGAGSNPYYVSGSAYLAGPYRGAPLSLVFITPAVAGPFDLGSVVVRAATFVNPVTAQVTVKSDQIPQILDGVPLQIRSIAVKVDRPSFTRNPTSCNPMEVGAQVSGSNGSGASLSSRFQVGSCDALGFKPKLSLQLTGPTHRRAHPALRAVLTAREGDANIGRASVTLPKTEFLENAHIRTVCTRVQYAARECPQGSIYGYARAWSPLLQEPLQGPVYLRSSDHELPDLVASLDGQIHIDLDGRIDSVHSRIRNTFEAIPDVPVSRFELKMQGGKKGLLVNNTELCEAKARARVLLDAQNGKTYDTEPLVRADCGKKRSRN